VLKKILVMGECIVPTGISTVVTNVLKNIPKDKFDIYHIGKNYKGDPHGLDWKIFPALIGGDVDGIRRIKDFSNVKFDGIFVFEDIWKIPRYVGEIRKYFDGVPLYWNTFIDSEEQDEEWFNGYDSFITKFISPTIYGKNELEKYTDTPVDVIPLGIDHKTFFKMDVDKKTIKMNILGQDSVDSFIVFNGNRNQPRKRLDLSMIGFAKFATSKPKNVKLYLHMGIIDQGWNILKLAKRLNIEDRLILSNDNIKIQAIDNKILNNIYNSCDIGLNTSIGEGWGLVNCEHAATGVAQVVPDNSASNELFDQTGLLIPIERYFYSTNLTKVSEINTDVLAKILNVLYEDRNLLSDISNRCYEKFSNFNYSWEHIYKNYWRKIFDEI
jgi:D-inositol-3-phosphate glycosyltransferase